MYISLWNVVLPKNLWNFSVFLKSFSSLRKLLFGKEEVGCNTEVMSSSYDLIVFFFFFSSVI